MIRLPFNGSFPTTQAFGGNHDYYYSNFKLQGHNGIDYGLPSGTEVVAADMGVARCYVDPPGFGNYIEITGSQYKTIYAHLKEFRVSNGAMVMPGVVIALSDNTGNSTGEHLHFGVKPIPQNNNNGYFGAIDPNIALKGEDMALDPADEYLKRIGLEVMKSKAWQTINNSTNHGVVIGNVVPVFDELFDFKAGTLANPPATSDLEQIPGPVYIKKK